MSDICRTGDCWVLSIADRHLEGTSAGVTQNIGCGADHTRLADREERSRSRRTGYSYTQTGVSAGACRNSIADHGAALIMIIRTRNISRAGDCRRIRRVTCNREGSRARATVIIGILHYHGYRGCTWADERSSGWSLCDRQEV